MTISWVFPGQGSQKIGMGSSVIQLENARKRFDFASNIFGRDLYEICEKEENGDTEIRDLNQTRNTQICLFLVESILVDSLKSNGLKPDFAAGHSLGEISALYSADVISFEQSVELIKVRSELMSNAGEGGMAAIIGFDRNELEHKINQIDDVVIANDNSASQVVLSGSKESLDYISSQIKFKRFVNLNVSGAFHSHFMKVSSQKFAEYLDDVVFNNPLFPVISNSNPTLCTDSRELKMRLKNQMCNGVRWRETMDLMKDKGNALQIVEIGPSSVLSGLAKRHLREVTIKQVSSSENLFY